MVCKANNNSKLFHFLIRNENSLCVGEQIKYDSLSPQSHCLLVLCAVNCPLGRVQDPCFCNLCTTGWLGQMLSQKNTLTFYDSFY